MKKIDMLEPKNKHPIPMPELNEHQLNEIVRKIEIAYRNNNNCWNIRLGSINASDVRKTIHENKIGVVCQFCLYNFKGRYCCDEHSQYYRILVYEFYGSQTPWTSRKYNKDSIDHIQPISMGGLEFDRDNLQWMDLTENICKGGINRTKAKIRKELAFAYKQALMLKYIIYRKKQKKLRKIDM